jgi:hypothetical protein
MRSSPLFLCCLFGSFYSILFPVGKSDADRLFELTLTRRQRAEKKESGIQIYFFQKRHDDVAAGSVPGRFAPNEKI